MTKFKVAKFKQVKKGWVDTIIDRIGEGKVLPCIGNQVSNNLIFGSHDALIKGWADTFDFPAVEDGSSVFFGSRQNFTVMTQYHSVMSKADPDLRADDRYIKELYLDYLLEVLFSIPDEELVEDLKADVNWKDLSFSEVARRLNQPTFENGRDNPLLLLAALPLPIYLTTSYHDLMEIALEKAGKSPRSEICYWNQSLKSIPSVFAQDKDYDPNKEEPLVYHLHGRDRHPDSLVLTEDDHLDFLVTISENPKAIHPRVRQALVDSSLILLGYRLGSWDFRVLFRGLIKTSANSLRPKSVSIQLAEDDVEKTYLSNYLSQEADFEVYWGDTLKFIQELHQGWNA
jgi:hypothetical protein